MPANTNNGFRWHIANGVAESNCWFMSKASTSNSVATPDNPAGVFMTVSDDSHTYMVMGDGNYILEAFPTNRVVQADGLVQITGQNMTMFKFYGGPTEPRLFDLRLVVGQSFNWGGTDNIWDAINRCFIRAQNGTAGALITTSGGSVYNVLSTVLKNMQSGSTPNKPRYINCLFVNCNLVMQYVQNSYSDPTTVLDVAEPANSFNNNIRGLIKVGAVTYQNLAEAKAADASWFPNCVNLPPNFNNALREDFTLRLNSPHLALGIGPSNLRYAQSWFVASSNQPGQVCTPNNTWLVNSADSTIINFISLTGFSWSQQNSLYITENTADNFTASYRTAPLQVASVAQTLKNLPVLTGFNFDTSFPATESAFDSNLPDVGNNNVPCVNNSTPGAAGRNPNHVTVAMRWSTAQVARNNIDTDWVTQAVFPVFSVNQQPTWNQGTGIGNGSPDFNPNPSNVQSVRVLWVQLEYTARNNYFH